MSITSESQNAAGVGASDGRRGGSGGSGDARRVFLGPRSTSSGVGAARPKRVLYLDHTASMGGGEIALLNLVCALDPVRYQPVVALFSDGPLAERLNDAGVETHVLPLDPDVLQTRKDTIGLATLLRILVVFRVVAHVIRVAKFIRRGRYDLVHANSLKADVIGGLAGRLAGVPVIWHVRDRIADDYLPPLVARGFRLLSRLVPTFIIANSEATLKTLRFADARRTAAVYSGIAVAHQAGVVHDGVGQGWGGAPQLTAMPADAQEIGRSGRGPVIGLVGRITRWKGQDVFLRAAAEVRRHFPRARFQIIGAALFAEHDYEQEVRALTRSLGLEQAVEFTGFRSDVPELVARLDVLVHASTTGEPFGQVVVEGMAAGKPVVATNGGGIPEIVVDGVTGFLVPMGDHRAMAGAVCRLLADPALAAQMGRLGRQRMLEYFTVKHTARRVHEVYDGLLGTSKWGEHSVHGHQPGDARMVARRGNVRRALLHHGAAVLLAVLATAAKVFIKHWWGTETGLSFAPFFAAVLISAWVGGLGPGLTATAASAALAAFYLLPPDRSFTVSRADRPRLWAFIVVATFSAVLIDLLQRANRRATRAYEEADAAHRRAAFLARATLALAAGLGRRSILGRLAYLVNSELSDWCAIDLIEPDGTVRRALAAHRDATLDPLARELESFAPEMKSDTDRTAKVLRSATPDLSRPFDCNALGAGASDPRQAQVLEKLGDRIFLIVPLISAGGVIGALTLGRTTEPNRWFDYADLSLVTELATRAAMALGSYPAARA